MMVVGIDLGGKMGIAVVDDDGRLIEARTIKINTGPGQPPHRRWLRAVDEIDAVLQRYGADPDIANSAPKVYFEHVRAHAGSTAAHHYGAYLAALQIALGSYDAEPISLAPCEIKKFATGKGNADKKAMMAAFRSRFGYAPIDDNAADAAYIALMGWSRRARD